MGNPLRKTLEYLGLVEEGEIVDEQPKDQRPRPKAPQAPSSSRTNVTPIRRTSAQVRSGDLNQILTVHPKKYSDVQVISEGFRQDIPVIINLSQMTEPDARRLVDFASGLASGLLGRIERVTPKVFLLSPQHVLVSGDEAEPAEEHVGLFADRD